MLFPFGMIAQYCSTVDQYCPKHIMTLSWGEKVCRTYHLGLIYSRTSFCDHLRIRMTEQRPLPNCVQTVVSVLAVTEIRSHYNKDQPIAVTWVVLLRTFHRIVISFKIKLFCQVMSDKFACKQSKQGFDYLLCILQRMT